MLGAGASRLLEGFKENNLNRLLKLQLKFNVYFVNFREGSMNMSLIESFQAKKHFFFI